MRWLMIIFFCFYTFTSNDITLMTQLLCGHCAVDGDGEYDIDFKDVYDQSQVDLVLSTVMNRVSDDRFPNTVSEVILQRGQFHVMPRNSRYKVSNKSREVVKRWCELYSQFGDVSHSKLYFFGDGIKNHPK